MNIFQSIAKYPGGLVSLFKESTSTTQKAAAAVGLGAAVTAGVIIAAPAATGAAIAGSIATGAKTAATKVLQFASNTITQSTTKQKIVGGVSLLAAVPFTVQAAKEGVNVPKETLSFTSKVITGIPKISTTAATVAFNKEMSISEKAAAIGSSLKQNKETAIVAGTVGALALGKAAFGLYSANLIRSNNSLIGESNEILKNQSVNIPKAAAAVGGVIPVSIQPQESSGQIINIYTQTPQEIIPPPLENAAIASSDGVIEKTTTKKKAKPKKKAKKKVKAKPKKKKKTIKRKKTVKKKKKK